MEHRKRGLVVVVSLALILLILSVLQAYAPEELVGNRTLLLFNAFFMYVIVVVCDETTVRLEGKSLLHEIFRSRRNIVLFIIAGTLGGLMLDGVAQWLGKLWVYPYWSSKFYVLVFAIGFTAYWLMIVESYLAAKAVLKRITGRRPHEERYYLFEPVLYDALGVAGAILLGAGAWLILRDYGLLGGYVFNVTTQTPLRTSFLYIMMLFLGFWFVLEYIEYREKRTSLLKDLLHHYGIPLLAIIASSSLLALFMEKVNDTHHFWLYTNWPLSHVTLLGLPVMMLIAWPLHYIAFLSLFRAISDAESRDVWR